MTKRIKVCHIITMLELGGAQQNTLYTVSHLNKDVYEPLLIAGKGGMLNAEARAIPGATKYFTSKLLRHICPICDLAGLFRLWWILIKEKPQIVHTHSSKAGILGRFAAWFAGVPVIIHTYHGFGFNERQIWPVRMIYILIERAAARISGKLVAVSQDNIEKALANKIVKREQFVLIRSGIEVGRFADHKIDKLKKKRELGIGPDDPVVTTIGPFKPQKNLRDFIDAAGKIAKKYPNCKFLIIGDGELRPDLELQIQGLCLTENLKLLGWRRDIAELLAITDVFVMTSLWEGLPRAVLEAMSTGIAVVANAVDGVKEIVENGETGYLVEPMHPEETAGRTLELLTDRKKSFEMGKKGKTKITREYDIDFMVRQLEGLYKNLFLK
jgi:glycosyltransferase involved in cell wall biosynthesis